MEKKSSHPQASVIKRIMCNGCVGWGALADLRARLSGVPQIVDIRPPAILGTPFTWGSCVECVLPFPEFWVEGRSPGDFGALWGALITRPAGTPPGFPEHTVVVMELFTCSPPRDVVLMGRVPVSFSPSGIPFFLNNSGLVKCSDNQPFAASPSQVVAAKLKQDGDSGCQEFFNVACTIANTVCEMLNLLGCKNIGLDPHPQDPAVVRHWKRTPPVGGYKYHTIGLRGYDGKPRCSTGTDAYKGTMPLHVCRGHYSEYGPKYGKGLLFGKYEGRFYIPAHAKGKRENGVVEADYTIGERNATSTNAQVEPRSLA